MGEGVVADLMTDASQLACEVGGELHSLTHQKECPGRLGDPEAIHHTGGVHRVGAVVERELDVVANGRRKSCFAQFGRTAYRMSVIFAWLERLLHCGPIPRQSSHGCLSLIVINPSWDKK